jgi:hypothetical protein
MDGALVAHRLIHAERALFDALFGIRKKPGAVAAQIPCRAMLGAAVDVDHSGNSPGFEVHSAVFI